MKIYAIFDKKAQAYENATLPMFRNDDLAKRGFQTAFRQKALGGLIQEYPEDFDLYCLGELDQKTGKIFPDVSFVCSFLDLKGEKENGE